MSDQTVEWLRRLADWGGKGVVGNIDARSLGRIADRLEQAEAERQRITNFLRQKDEAMGILFDRLAKAGVDCSDLIS